MATYFSGGGNSTVLWKASQRFGGGRRKGFLSGLQGGLEGGGGLQAADGAVHAGEGVQVLFQFVRGETGIQAGELPGKQGEAVAHAQRVLLAEIALGPAVKGEAGADFLLHHGRVGGGSRSGVADALTASGTDAGLLRGREEEGMGHAGGLGIGREGLPEGLGPEDEGGDGRDVTVHKDVREDAVRTGFQTPFFVRFGQVPMEDVITVMIVDAAAHALDTDGVEVHARGQETDPFRLGGGVKAAFPQGLPGEVHRHHGKRETVLEIRLDGADGLGTGQVHDDGAEAGVFLEGKHGKGPVEGVQVPGGNDEGDLGHKRVVLSLQR